MSFLIPIGVVFYAAIGGLKATFTTSYFHTVIVYVVCCVFLYKVFIPNDLLGGIDDVRSRPRDPFLCLRPQLVNAASSTEHLSPEAALTCLHVCRCTQGYRL